MSGTGSYEPAPNYQTPPGYQNPPASRGGSGMAIASLVLGILALITSFTVFGGIVLGLLAVILGVIAMRGINRGLRSGRGMAIAGIVTGALGLILAIVLIAVGVSILNSPAGKNLQSCLKDANGNQQAVQNCQNQYRNSVSH